MREEVGRSIGLSARKVQVHFGFRSILDPVLILLHRSGFR
jgi:hypothetical protein